MKVAYCTGFWSTNIGNGFFSLGVEYILKNILGNKNVTVVSDYQTYANEVGKRNWPSVNQLEYISKLEVDYIVLAGPVISKYFLPLWKDVLVKLHERGIGYILLSAGMMKMDEQSEKECEEFFKQYPPYILASRETKTYERYGEFAINSYNGICFAFFTPDYYEPAKISMDKQILTLNFDKMIEPEIKINESKTETDNEISFVFNNDKFKIRNTSFNNLSSKTDRYTDALIYMRSIIPQKKMPNQIDEYSIIRTDHRFYPHYRSKIYSQGNTICADLPYAYINAYANSNLTLSDRIHACAVTLAYGNYAMLFARTNRIGLLDRVGASSIINEPVKLDLDMLNKEKENLVNWLKNVLTK